MTFLAFSIFNYHYHPTAQITPMEAEMFGCVVGDGVDLQTHQLGPLHLHSSHQEQKMGLVLAQLGEEGKTQPSDPFPIHNGDFY